MKLHIVALTTSALAVAVTAIAIAATPPPAVTGGVLGTGALTVHPAPASICPMARGS